MAEMKSLTINGTPFTLSFAPAGYGLGGTVYNQSIVAHIQNADQLNTATKCGWYACAFGDGGGAYTLYGVTMWNAVLFVSSYIDSRLCQELYATQQGVKFIRWCYNGTWTEWECVNPPMVPGVEYRTTERSGGAPVYAKQVYVGNLPNASSKYTESLLPMNITPVSIQGVGVGGVHAIPIPSMHTYVSVDGEWGTLYVATDSDYSNYGGYITVKYTKN